MEAPTLSTTAAAAAAAACATTLPRRLRRYSVRKLQTMSDSTLGSYTVGASPSNGYRVCATEVQFRLDTLAAHRHVGSRAAGTTGSAPEDGATAEVFLVTTGAPALHPKSRGCTVKFAKGRWFVRNFDRLCAPVRGIELPPLPELDAVEEALEDVSASILNYIVPQACRPMPFQKESKVQAESRAEHLSRCQKAAADTSGLAEHLALKEMYDRWTIAPNLLRHLVDGNGAKSVIVPSAKLVEAHIRALQLPGAQPAFPRVAVQSSPDPLDVRTRRASTRTLVPPVTRNRTARPPTRPPPPTTSPHTMCRGTATMALPYIAIRATSAF